MRNKYTSINDIMNSPGCKYVYIWIKTLAKSQSYR